MNWLRGYAIHRSSSVGSPEPTWHPCKAPVLRLPPPPRAFRHHVIANVVQRLQRRYGLVVIEAVGEPSRLSMGKEFAFATNGQVQRNLWPLTVPRWPYKRAVFPVVEIRFACFHELSVPRSNQLAPNARLPVPLTPAFSCPQKTRQRQRERYHYP